MRKTLYRGVGLLCCIKSDLGNQSKAMSAPEKCAAGVAYDVPVNEVHIMVLLRYLSGNIQFSISKL